MRRPLSRLIPDRKFPLVLAVACLSLAGPQVGCDRDEGDASVRQLTDEAAQSTETAVKSAPTVPAALEKAVGVQNASPTVKIDALAQLAEAKIERAVGLFNDIDRSEVEVLRLIAEVNRLGARIQSNNTLVAGLSALNPQKTTQAIEGHRGALQGGEKEVWVEHDSGSIPALKAVEARITELQGQIGKLEQQSKDLAKQRTQLIGEAEKLERQSEEARGRQSVELYNKSSEARKRAADLGVQVEVLGSKLTPLRQDLQRAQENQKILAKAAESFGQQLKSTEANWAAIQKQMADVQALSKQILGPDPKEPAAPPPPPQAQPEDAGDDAAEDAPAKQPKPAAKPPPGGLVNATTIVGKMRFLQSYLGQIQQQRAEAEKLLSEALGHYQAAGSTAQQLNSQLQQKVSAAQGRNMPERGAWQSLMELNNDARFKVKQSAIQLLLAGLHRNRAAELTLRHNMLQTLHPILKQAQLALPAEVNEQGLDAQANEARTASTKLYDEANEVLTGVVEGPKGNESMTEAARQAQVLRLVGMYGRSQLLGATEPDKAAALLKEARTVARDGDPSPNALPGFVQDILELRAPATTQPASGTRRTTGRTGMTPAPPAGGGTGSGTPAPPQPDATETPETPADTGAKDATKDAAKDATKAGAAQPAGDTKGPGQGLTEE